MPTFNPNNSSNNSNSNQTPRLPYFKINPGETKIVRFVDMDDPNAWTFEFCHDISRLGAMNTSQAKYKWVKARCLNDNCPFCEYNKQTSNKRGLTSQAIIKMVVYENGKANPVAWARTSSFLENLYPLATTYAPFSNNLFVVSRMGNGLDTKYSVLPAPPQYNPAQYPLDMNVFNGYDCDPVSYLLTPTAEEAFNLINFGQFKNPNEQKQNTQTTATYQQPVAPQPVPATTPVMPQAPVMPAAPAQTPVMPTVAPAQAAPQDIETPTWLIPDANAFSDMPSNTGFDPANPFA